VLVELIKL